MHMGPFEPMDVEASEFFGTFEKQVGGDFLICRDEHVDYDLGAHSSRKPRPAASHLPLDGYFFPFSAVCFGVKAGAVPLTLLILPGPLRGLPLTPSC